MTQVEIELTTQLWAIYRDKLVDHHFKSKCPLWSDGNDLKVANSFKMHDVFQSHDCKYLNTHFHVNVQDLLEVCQQQIRLN